MLSRVADSLYWMSRYLERAEHTARLIDVDLQLRLDQSPEAGAGRWLRLLEASQVPAPEDGKIDAGVADPRSHARPHESVFHFVLRRRGAREPAPGARAVQHGNVGAAEPAVPAGQQHHRERGVAAAFARILSRGAGGRASVSGRDRFDHVARRGMAVHPTGTIRRAHRRTGAA